MKTGKVFLGVAEWNAGMAGAGGGAGGGRRRQRGAEGGRRENPGVDRLCSLKCAGGGCGWGLAGWIRNHRSHKFMIGRGREVAEGVEVL